MISADAQATAYVVWPRCTMERIANSGFARQADIDALHDSWLILSGARLMSEPDSYDFFWFSYLMDSIKALIDHYTQQRRESFNERTTA